LETGLRDFRLDENLGSLCSRLFYGNLGALLTQISNLIDSVIIFRIYEDEFFFLLMRDFRIR